MPNATISAPTGTQAGNFNVMATFDVAVTGFDKTDVKLIARTENGITGIDFEITGSGMDYNIFFTLPENVEGSFQISITGMVTPDGSSIPEAVMANTPTVIYDNTVNVTATFGTIEYRDGSAIAVPITFGDAVIAPSKSICEITHLSGDALTNIDYRLVGEGTAYELVFEVPPDRVGSFRVAITGDVFKVVSHVWDNVMITPIDVNYDTRVPRIVDYDIPENYTHGAKFDIRIAFNVPVTGWHANNTFTEIFIEEGARLGQPLPHKWTGNSPPNFNDPVPDDLAGTEWQVLATPPGGHAGEWHGEEGQYFLIRFTDVQDTATGIFNMTLRENAVRGPIGG